MDTTIPSPNGQTRAKPRRFRLSRLTRLARSPHAVAALLALGSLAFVITAYAGFLGLREIGRLTDARKSAYEGIIDSAHTLLALTGMESSHRGYVLTGTPSLSAAFAAFEADFQTTYQHLQEQLQHEYGDAFAGRKMRMDALIEHRIASAKYNMALRTDDQLSLRQFSARYQSGEQAMLQLMDEVKDIEAHFRNSVKNSELRIEQVRARTYVLVGALTLFGGFLVACALRLLNRERRLRDNAESALHQFSGRLERLVDERTDELRQAMGQIQSFTKQLDKSIEAERRRLAREVHDQFGQIVTATKMMVIEMSRNYPQVPENCIHQITSLLDEAISITRRIASELRPPLLDDLGLFAAMQLYARNFTLRSKLDTLVDVSDDELLSASQANQLFRIFQEATTNVLRHARAKRISVRGGAVEGNFELEIADDGRGPQPLREDSTGLRNMRERASLAGGSFQFIPGPERGSVARVVIPLHATPTKTDFIHQEPA